MKFMSILFELHCFAGASVRSYACVSGPFNKKIDVLMRPPAV